jgi:hypothetical protein
LSHHGKYMARKLTYEIVVPGGKSVKSAGQCKGKKIKTFFSRT